MAVTQIEGLQTGNHDQYDMQQKRNPIVTTPSLLLQDLMSFVTHLIREAIVCTYCTFDLSGS